MREIAPDVFVEDRFSTHAGEYRGGNYGYVRTTDGIVVIDTPEWPSMAVDLGERLESEGSVRFLLNTHSHIDHVGGNAFVPGECIAHDLAREELVTQPGLEMASGLLRFLFDADAVDERIDRLEAVSDGETTWGDLLLVVVEEGDPEAGELLADYELRTPNATFSDELTLHVGGYTFELSHLPGHAPGHVGVYVREADVLFAGDNVANGVYPSFWTAQPEAWVDSLGRLEAYDAEVVVPGHGEVCDTDEVRAFRSFVEDCIRRVEDAVDRGLDEAETVDAVSLDDGDRPPLHPTRESVTMDVVRLHRALST